MTVSSRRVWRASPPTLALVWTYIVVAAVAIPVLAYLIYREIHSPLVPSLLALLTVVTVVYAWRFGLHPRVIADDDGVEVVNPFRRQRIEWDDLSTIAPGENGLLIGSAEALSEAWCIQKSNRATRAGRETRADRISDELYDLLEQAIPPVSDDETGLRIRRARADEAKLLTRIERAASEATLGHVYPPDEYPFPSAAIARRWRRLLRDRKSWVYVLEQFGTPVGYVGFGDAEIVNLGVVPQQLRRGFGSALLEFAALEMFDRGALELRLWVLVENYVARSFFRGSGWTETKERRDASHPPQPRELQLVRRNPAAPRRSRA